MGYDEPPLVWSSDVDPGIRRLKRGRGFVYLDPAGRPIRDEDELQRIRALAVPPAYREVWICAHANGHLQATGRDARGRKQYRYHRLWQAARGESKFDHLLAFGHALPRLRRRVQRLLSAFREPSREVVLAALARLLDTTWMRIGNAAYVRSNGSYGLSTLENRHAALRGGEIRLTFAGKSGVRHEVRLADRRVAALLNRCRELPGRELFQYRGDDGAVHRIDSTDVNAWLAASAACEVTAKAFRTWHASVLALDLILAASAEGAVACTLPDVISDVARRLGNTRAVCRKSYIHPAVLDLAPALTDAGAAAALQLRRWVHAPPTLRALSVGERRLLGLLKASR